MEREDKEGRDCEVDTVEGVVDPERVGKRESISYHTFYLDFRRFNCINELYLQGKTDQEVKEAG